jgi:(p)ppGpp synthase/HD superfamily hydrolase
MQAYRDAKEAHRGQMRDDEIRYFEHVRATAVILIAEFGVTDPDGIIAALLHDAAEDTDYFGPRTTPGVLWANVETQYGERAMRLIAAVTKPSPWKGTKAAKDRYYSGIAAEESLAWAIKFADRIHNLRSLTCWQHKRQLKYLVETETYILPLAERYAEETGNKVPERLLRKETRHLRKRVIEEESGA